MRNDRSTRTSTNNTFEKVIDNATRHSTGMIEQTTDLFDENDTLGKMFKNLNEGKELTLKSPLPKIPESLSILVRKEGILPRVVEQIETLLN